MIQSVLLLAENDEESSECLVGTSGSGVQILGVGLFWNTQADASVRSLYIIFQ